MSSFILAVGFIIFIFFVVLVFMKKKSKSPKKLKPRKTLTDNQPSIVINIDSSLQEDKLARTAWGVYGSIKAQWKTGEYFKQHPEVIDKNSLFEEEYHARESMIVVWKVLQENNSNGNTYLNTLLEVVNAGFLREYIWNFISNDDWLKPNDLKLEEFSEWLSINNLNKHQPKTLAYIYEEKNRPEFLLQKLPQKIHNFKAEKINIYEDDRMGASLGYNKLINNNNIPYTLYLFDNGCKNISFGMINDIYEDSKNDIKYLGETGQYKELSIGKDQVFPVLVNLNDGGSSIDVHYVGFSYLPEGSNDNKKVNSFLFISIVNGYIFKMRATFSEVNEETWKEMMRFVSTGLRCLNS